MDQWIDGSADQWISGSIGQQVNGSIGPVDRQISTDRWIASSMARQISRSMDRQIYGSEDQGRWIEQYRIDMVILSNLHTFLQFTFPEFRVRLVTQEKPLARGQSMIKICLFVDSFCVCRFYSYGVNFIVYLITSLALTRGSIERTPFLFLLSLSFQLSRLNTGQQQ